MNKPILEMPPWRPRGEAGQKLDPQLEMLARLMDSVFHIPGLGLRFGLDALIGLIPGLGDIFTSAVSLFILNAASATGVPRITLVRMAMNIALDGLLGAIPFVGDLFDIYWKANQKNVELLRRHVEDNPTAVRRERSSDWLFVGGLMAALIMLLIGCAVCAYWILAWVGHGLGALLR